MSEPLTGPGGPPRNQSLPDHRDAVLAERDALAARLASVEALHHEDGEGFCYGCGYDWPCATAAALGSDAHTEQKGAVPGYDGRDFDVWFDSSARIGPPVTASDARPEYEPFLVDPGWVHADIIGSPVFNPPYRLLTYGNGTVRFEHRCERGERGTIICAPALQIGNGHTLARNGDGKPTVTPSILCPDCGTHGFVTDGRWADA